MMAPRIATMCGLVFLMNSLSHAQAADAMIRYDNTRIFDHPLFKDLIRWTLDTQIAQSDGTKSYLVEAGAGE